MPAATRENPRSSMDTPFLLPEGNVQIAFSGGRSSACMLHRILQANGSLPESVQVLLTIPAASSTNPSTSSTTARPVGRCRSPGWSTVRTHPGSRRSRIAPLRGMGSRSRRSSRSGVTFQISMRASARRSSRCARRHDIFAQRGGSVGQPCRVSAPTNPNG